jgi:type II secretory ATPase GspE/PulE/Tfp pilus assembly ATPase PilB-like protein
MEKEFEEFQSDSERIAKELASALNLPYFNLQFFRPEIEALDKVPIDWAKKTKSIPIKINNKDILLGVVDPYNQNFKDLKEDLEKKGFKVKTAIISDESFQTGLKEYNFLPDKKISYLSIFEINSEILNYIKNKVNTKEELSLSLSQLSLSDPFLILDYVFGGAIKFDSSDIHFEPYEDKVFVRFRIDGILYDIFSFPLNIYPLLKNRIKILSGMKINVYNKPQDGRFSLNYEGQKIDIRVSSVPSTKDESIVCRILKLSSVTVELESLGLREDDLKILNQAIYSPNGLILNTGPTGSGKTTTLYSVLIKIKKPELKILTIEDPVEYKIEGISQSQVNEESGFTFSNALRSFLRHDPDIILVGEIRDKETAQIAVQASLTGHLVLSTLHTNDALGAIPRLISLGVDPQLIPPALRLVIAQRLLRKICPYCAIEYTPEDDLKEKIKNKLKDLPSRVNLKDIDLNNFSLLKPKGCQKCLGLGYKGRLAIFELLSINKKLESIIEKNPSEAEIYEAVSDNFVSLQQDGLIKALFKITSIEEVERVTGLIN